MAGPPTTRPAQSLDDYVERFEEARSGGRPADPARFLPPPSDPLRLPVLRELLRVDLDRGWAEGSPTSLSTYRERFPELFDDPGSAQAVAFEEYRQRLLAGDRPSRADYQERFGVDASDWPAPEGGEVCAGDLGATLRVYRNSERAPAAEPDVEPVRPSAEAAKRSARGGPPPPPWPEVGGRFAGFVIDAELGRGAFGRVYLARQGALAHRPVVLKVGPDLFGESQNLAQLQHTHIVPVYSLHQDGPLQAVCMPYLGAVTLADVLKELQDRPRLPEGGSGLASALAVVRAARTPAAALRPAPGAVAVPCAIPGGLGYVGAVLWLGARLADGLAHAHERGILHRDLKPANVLLTDDGQPMLLDFNLSEDTKRHAATPPEFVGGTLPYMAPEHLDAFADRSGPVDARGDVYALGVLLFELATGRQPFPTPAGALAEVVAALRKAHRRRPPDPRALNSEVTPAAAAVLRRCLEPDPARRYPSARALREDLERHLQDLPLLHTAEPSPRERAGKWLRRHPSLTSSAGVGFLSAVLLFVLVVAWTTGRDRLLRLDAAEALQKFRQEAHAVRVLLLADRVPDPARLDEGMLRCRRLLARYRVLEDAGWRGGASVRLLPSAERDRLAGEVGGLLLLWARVQALRATLRSGGDPAPALQAALGLNERAGGCYPPGATPRAVWYQRANLVRGLGRAGEADELLKQAAAAPLSGARDRTLLASELAAEGRHADALRLLREAVRAEPGDPMAWYDLALCQESLGRDREAAGAFGTCAALAPEFPHFVFKRGAAYLRVGDYEQALADLDDYLARRPGRPEAHLNRALARAGLGDESGALADLSLALEGDAGLPRAYLLRARIRARRGDAAGASADRAEGLRREPRDELGWVERGTARLADDPAGALSDFDRALALNPRSRTALQNKAHVLAERLGRPREAVAALTALLAAHPGYAPALAGRAVLLARLGERGAAHRDAAEALRLDAGAATRYQAACVHALTASGHPADAIEALDHLALALRAGYGADLLARDRDLDALRPLPAFQALAGKYRAGPQPGGTPLLTQ